MRGTSVAVGGNPLQRKARTPSISSSVSTASTVSTVSTASTDTFVGGRDPDPLSDIDELARRLFDPLFRLLRAELRQERERSGRLRDTRH